MTENNNNDYYSQNIIDNSNETSFYENSSDVSKEKVYVHTAIEGAVIVEQDGSKEFSYQGHCEACGKTDTTMTKQTRASSGEITSAFLCPNCSNQQKIIYN